MPVCIAGMHRSGTSMIARLLNLCGLYLGDESEFIPASAVNAEGFWEHRGLMKLNEEILEQLGLAWDLPFAAPSGWESRPEIVALQSKATALLQPLRYSPWWGWKDPRTSLTLPFWKALLPNLRVVVCLRNPVEVARSLYRRGASSERFSHSLWLSYYRQLLATTSPDERVVTHYDAYFCDAEQELQRIVCFLGLHASERTIERACAAVTAPLRHHTVAASEALRTVVPPEVMDLYTELCAQAGPVYEAAVTTRQSSDRVLASGGVARCEASTASAASAATAGRLQANAKETNSIPDVSRVEQPVSVVILSWDGCDASSWLASLQAASYPPDKLAIILPDNGEHSLVVAQSEYCPWRVRRVRVEAGSNCAAAANSATDALQGAYVAFLDADVQVKRGWMREFMAVMQAQPDLACIGATVLSCDGQTASVGMRGDPFGLTRGLEDTRPLGGGEVGGYTLAAAKGVALYRRQAFQAVGGFDPHASAPYEDVDLGWRLWLCGHKCALAPGVFGSCPERPWVGPSNPHALALAQSHALAAAVKYLEQDGLDAFLPTLFYALLEQGLGLPATHSALAVAVHELMSSLGPLLAARAEAQAMRVSSDREIFALTGGPFDRLLQAVGSTSAQGDLAALRAMDLGTADVQVWRLALAEWLNVAHFRHERHLAAEVIALSSSPGWGLVRALRGIRLRLVPAGSKRESLLELGPAGLATWKQEGFRPMVRRGFRLLRRLAR